MRMTAGFLFLVLALQGSAAALNSTRGEWGLAVAFCVVAVAWAVQRGLHGDGLKEAGVRRGRLSGVALAVALSAAMVAAAAIYVHAVDARVAVHRDALWLALGILAQGGIAEELAFRGYLYGRLRRTRTFWRAALTSMAPFAAVHLILFLTMDWPIALAALLLSIALTFPYAHLYEISGNAIWAPAVLHAATQAGPKLATVDDPAFPLIWMGLALVFSSGVFLVPGKTPPAD